jgi:hypothetical protein
VAETVGDRLVKGMWKAEAHLGVLGTVGKGCGVFGTVGKGYDGVRRAWAMGVGGMLPRIVCADSVDSVDSVDEVMHVASGVGLGLVKAPSSVGDMLAIGSSLMGEMRRKPSAATVVALEELRMRACCWWCCINEFWRDLRRSISTSSGDALPGGATSTSPPTSSSSSPCGLSSSLMSVSVVPSSRSGLGGGCWARGDVCE